MTDESVENRINLLQRVELFSTLAPDELEIVAYHSQMVRYRSGSLIFMEDSPGIELYVIKEGEVLITRRRGGDDVDIAQFIAYESFGEWDLFGDTPRTATAVATKESVLLVFPREGMNFHMFLQKYPKMSARMIYKLLAIIARRIRSTHLLINEKTPWVRNLKKQMLLDKLTGLYNKNFLIDECDGLLSQGDSPSALLIIKPDNFKEINDRFGHEAGDQLLILMSIFIMSALRESDIAVRYGGDEFAVVLPRTARDEAVALARDLGIVLHGMDIEQITGHSRLKITVSIGITLYPLDGADTLTLALGAREKMLRARAKGGNRIIA
jgi:diguanylate cyclase (GGDEF)-like protein